MFYQALNRDDAYRVLLKRKGCVGYALIIVYKMLNKLRAKP